MTTADWIKTRRELLNAATEGPWRWSNRQGVYLFGKRSRVVMAFGRMGMHGAQPQFCDERGILQDGGRANLNSFPDAALIADARTSLPLALEALEAVLARHRPVSYVATANCGLVLYEVCPTCHDKAGVHPCGCWRDEDQIHVCADCKRVWPCPTFDAIDTALRGDS